MEHTIDSRQRGATSSTSGSKTGAANLACATSVSSTSSAATPRLVVSAATQLRLASSATSKALAPKSSPPNEESPLPSLQEWWTPSDLAAYLHLTPNAITYHCRRLFPIHPEGYRYRLSHADAVRVYNYVRKFGCKKEPDPTS